MAQKLRPQAETLSGSPQPNFIGYQTAPILAKRAPTAQDTGYPLGQLWLDKTGDDYYGLVDVSAGVATWNLLAATPGEIATLTGDSGGAISPSAGNVNVLGTASQITTTGSGSTITWSLPNAITAPGSLTTTTTLASGTTITAGTSITATLGAITATNGNFVKGTAGNKDVYSSVASSATAGANSAGTVTLVGGTATVATTAVTASSKIRFSRQGIGATGAAALGIVTIGTITAGTSFVINSVQAADATALQASDVSSIWWEIVN